MCSKVSIARIVPVCKMVRAIVHVGIESGPRALWEVGTGILVSVYRCNGQKCISSEKVSTLVFIA